MPIVVKASGLAAGKGAVVAMTVEEALHALDAALNQGWVGGWVGRPDSQQSSQPWPCHSLLPDTCCL